MFKILSRVYLGYLSDSIVLKILKRAKCLSIYCPKQNNENRYFIVVVVVVVVFVVGFFHETKVNFLTK